MKSLLTSALLILTCGLAVNAAHLTAEQAFSRVQAQFPASRATSLTVADESTGYYIIKVGEQRYAIVSSDSEARAFLGEFQAENFSKAQMPENMKNWLAGYDHQVQWLQNHEVTPLKSKAPERLDSISPLIKSDWDQRNPYNAMCPMIDGDNCLVGCVATAMSMIMKYYNWPAKGKGSNSYVTRTEKLEVSMDFNDVEFDWTNILVTYPWYATVKQRKAVALLCSACGVAVDMDYGLGSSGAYSEDVPNALINNFSYDKWCSFLLREYYTDEQWNDLLYNELANGRPVYYSGDDREEGGHAFICDGYDNQQGTYHFNWGWGGDYDGYFQLDALDTNHGNFNYDQGMVVYFQKPTEYKVKPWQIVASNGLSGTVPIRGRLVLNAYDNPVQQEESMFLNLSTPTFEGSIGAIVVNRETNDTLNLISKENVNLTTDHGYTNLTFELNQLPADGAYDFYPAYNDGNGWRKMSINSPTNTCVVVTKEGNTYKAKTPQEFERDQKYQWENYGTAIYNVGGLTEYIIAGADSYAPEVKVEQSSTTPGVFRIKGAFSDFYQSLKSMNKYKYYSAYDVMVVNASNPEKAYLEDCSTGITVTKVGGEAYMVNYTSTVYKQMKEGETPEEALYGTYKDNVITFPGGDNELSSLMFSRGNTWVYYNQDGNFKLTLTEDSGINGLKEDAQTTCWYNLMGQKVNNPQKGVYIKVQGGKALKVMVL